MWALVFIWTNLTMHAGGPAVVPGFPTLAQCEAAKERLDDADVLDRAACIQVTP